MNLLLLSFFILFLIGNSFGDPLISYKTSTIKRIYSASDSRLSYDENGCPSIIYWVSFEGQDVGTIAGISSNDPNINGISFSLEKTEPNLVVYELSLDIKYEGDGKVFTILVETSTQGAPLLSFDLVNSPLECTKPIKIGPVPKSPIFTLNGQNIETEIPLSSNQFFRGESQVIILCFVDGDLDCKVRQSQYSPDILILRIPLTEERIKRNVVTIEIKFDSITVLNVPLTLPYGGLVKMLSTPQIYPPSLLISNEYAQGQNLNYMAVSLNIKGDEGSLFAVNSPNQWNNDLNPFSLYNQGSNTGLKTVISLVKYDWTNDPQGEADPSIRIKSKNSTTGELDTIIASIPKRTVGIPPVSGQMNLYYDSDESGFGLYTINLENVSSFSPIFVNGWASGYTQIPPYPYGIKKSGYDYEFTSSFLTNYPPRSMNLFRVRNGNNSGEISVWNQDYPTDLIEPSYTILSKDTFQSFVIYRISITDDSGVYKIYCSNNEKIYYAIDTLVSGSLTNGIFEIVVDLNDLVISTFALKITITDVYNNVRESSYDLMYAGPNLSYPYDLFSPLTRIHLKDISSIGFTYNSIDTSAMQGRINSIFIELLPKDGGIDRNLRPKLRLLSNNKTYVGEYDDFYAAYRIDFEVPFKSELKLFPYELLFPGSTFSYKTLYSALGDSVLLKFTNVEFDNYPPMFTKIEMSDYIIDFFIKDLSSGFRNGTISIASRLKPDPVAYHFDKSNRASGDIFNGLYQIPVAKSKRLDRIAVVEVILFDNSGHASYFPPRGDLNQLSPFFEIGGYSFSKYSVQTNGYGPVDLVPPFITRMSFTIENLNTFLFSFGIDDDSNLSVDYNNIDVAPPLIYLTGRDGLQQILKPIWKGDEAGKPFFFIEILFEDIDYRLMTQGFLISIYRIYDGSGNIAGYSAMDLKALGFPYYFKGLGIGNAAPLPPIVDSISNLYTTGGSVTISGKRFSQSSVQVKTQQDTITTLEPTFISSMIIVYDFPAVTRSTSISINITSFDAIEKEFILVVKEPSQNLIRGIYVDPLSLCQSDCGSKENPFSSIKSALASLQPKAKVNVILKDGIYKGPDNVQLDLVDINVNLMALNDPTKVSINCEKYYYFLKLSSSESFSLRNVTIENCTGGKGGAIFFKDSKVIIKNVRFVANQALNGGAIYSVNSVLKIENSFFYQNIAFSSGSAIYSYLSNIEIRGQFTNFKNNRNAQNQQLRDILCQNSTLFIHDQVLLESANVRCLQGCDGFYSQRDICQQQKPVEPFVCGDDKCSSGESCLSCPNDCSCYIEGMVQESFEQGCSPISFVPDSNLVQGNGFGSADDEDIERCISIRNSTLSKVEIKNLMGGMKNVVIRLFGYVSIENSKDVEFNFQGENFGLIFKVNGQQQFFFNQNTFFNETKSLYLVDKHVHFIEIILFTTVVEGSQRAFRLVPFNDLTTKLFYSNLVCGDGVLNEKETIDKDYGDGLNFYCISDLQYPIFKDHPVCGDSICNEDRDSCFKDCYIEYNSICPATQVPDGAISPGFAVGEDTLGALISNQFIWRLPGSEHLSYGVNIVNGEEGALPLFQFDYCQDPSTNVLEDVYRGKLYQIPQDFNVKAVPECSYSTFTDEYSSVDELAESMFESTKHEASVDASAGIIVKVKFSAAYSQEKSVQTAKKSSKSLADKIFKTDLVCKSTYVEIDTSKVTLHPSLLEQFNQIDDPKKMLRLVQSVGTHYYRSSFLGGKLTQIATTHESNVNKEYSNANSEAYSASFSLSVSNPFSSVSAGGGMSLDRNNDKATQNEIMEKSSISRIITYGGAPAAFTPSQDGASTPSFGEWAKSIDQLPVPIDYKLSPISQLINKEWINQHGVNISDYWLQAEEMFYNINDWTTRSLTEYTLIMEFNKVDGVGPLYDSPVLSIQYFESQDDMVGKTIKVPITLVETDKFGKKIDSLFSQFQELYYTDYVREEYALKFGNGGMSYKSCRPVPVKNMANLPFKMNFKAPDFFNSPKVPIIKIEPSIKYSSEFLIWSENKAFTILQWETAKSIIFDRNGVITGSDKVYGVTAFENKWAEWTSDVVQTSGASTYGLGISSNPYTCNPTVNPNKCVDKLYFNIAGNNNNPANFDVGFDTVSQHCSNRPSNYWNMFQVSAPESKNYAEFTFAHKADNIGLASRMNWVLISHPPSSGKSWLFTVKGFHVKNYQYSKDLPRDWINGQKDRLTRTYPLDLISQLTKQLFFFHNYNFGHSNYITPSGFNYAYFDSFIESRNEYVTTKFTDLGVDYTYWTKDQYITGTTE
ncbi:hypothetical protein CYY_003804 [Polysphondylium violaceum]|uniref:MACPF domain-containing protein n=1 Tax=Polysphondylium violaceum TaxID=133409 RepID=A0A8J4PX60_9MYCE|nr:hypothetical protein CYY_003804 [Polysphondylium violaceum]